MLKLIKNEWMKLWAKKATWVMLIITILASFTLLFGMKWVSSLDDGNKNEWKNAKQEEIQSYKAELSDPNLTKKQAQKVEDQQKIAQYELDHNINPWNINNSATFMKSSASLMAFASLFTIIVAAGIVSFEFSTGTIKMLLTRPIKRWKILCSKLITTLLFAFVITAVTYVLNAILSLTFFGDKGAILEVVNHKVVSINPYLAAFESYSLEYATMLTTILFAFMLGTVFRSSSLAIGLTLFITFASAPIIMLLNKYAFVKYIWFSVTDVSSIKTNSTMIPDLTMPFALSVLAAYAIIFTIISFIVFNKRDVTA